MRHANLRTLEPSILFVGSLFNRRHIPELIHAFAHVASAMPEATLVLVGDNRTRPHLDPLTIARDAGVADRVQWRAYVGDAELDALYDAARVFAFLSDYEGFAMTPLEALAHGVPSVLLDTPVSREVYGDAARLVDATPAHIAAGLLELIEDETARAAVLAGGRRVLERYRWGETARRVRTAIEAAAR